MQRDRVENKSGGILCAAAAGVRPSGAARNKDRHSFNITYDRPGMIDTVCKIYKIERRGEINTSTSHASVIALTQATLPAPREQTR